MWQIKDDDDDDDIKPQAGEKITQMGRSLYKQSISNYVMFLYKTIPSFVSRLAPKKSRLLK